MIVFYRKYTMDMAAAITFLNNDSNMYMRAVGYNEDLPYQVLRKEQVILLGVTFSEKELRDLVEIAESVWFFDHHKPGLEYMRELGIENLVVKGDTHSPTCITVWHHFFPGKPVPRPVESYGKYNLWKLDKEVLSFRYGLDMTPRGNQTMDRLVDIIKNNKGEYERTITNGEYVYEYRSLLDKAVAKDLVFRTQFEGYEALAANVSMPNSLFFNHIEEREVEIGIQYIWMPKQSCWKCTLSKIGNIEMPMSKIAERFGGNGSEEIAGFRLQQIDPPVVQKSNPETMSPHNGDVYPEVKEYADKHSPKLDQFIRQEQERNGWVQYGTKLGNIQVAAANLPTRLWPIKPYKSGDACMQISWVWDASGAYRNIIIPITMSVSEMYEMIDEHEIIYGHATEDLAIVHTQQRLV